MNSRYAAGDDDKTLNLETVILFGATALLFSAITLFIWVMRFLSLDTRLGLATNWSWYLSRSTALVAYLLITGSVAWGLVLSTKLAKKLTPPPLAMSIHNYISWLALTFGWLHAYLLLFDRYYTYNLRDLLVPFVGPYKPLPVGLGVAAGWVFFAASASFSVKKRIGHTVWRAIHLLTFPAFLMLTAHGLLAGTDSGNPGMIVVYGTSSAIVVGLTLIRLLSLRAKTPVPQLR